MAIASAVSAVATVAIFFATCNSLRLSERQLEAVSESNRSAVRQLMIAAGALAETRKNNTETGQAIKESNETAAKFAGAAQESAIAAAATLNLSRANSDFWRRANALEMRAWVLVANIAGLQLKPNTVYQVPVTFHNAGRLPAKIFYMTAQPTRIAAGIEFPVADPPYVRRTDGVVASQVTWPPNVPFVINAQIEALGEAEVERIMSGHRTLYLYGYVLYGDPAVFEYAYEPVHVTRFCGYYNPKGRAPDGTTGTFDICGFYNDAH
jgi:hypothetical protein